MRHKSSNNELSWSVWVCVSAEITSQLFFFFFSEYMYPSDDIKSKGLNNSYFEGKEMPLQREEMYSEVANLLSGAEGYVNAQVQSQ